MVVMTLSTGRKASNGSAFWYSAYNAPTPSLFVSTVVKFWECDEKKRCGDGQREK